MNHEIDAAELLADAAAAIERRAAERGTKTERSMARTVRIFKALTGRKLTETDGWIFMVCLKLARSRAGAFVGDDYLDAAAYVALAAESKAKERQREYLAAIKDGSICADCDMPLPKGCEGTFRGKDGCAGYPLATCTCGHEIVREDDEAQVCIECGGRNRRCSHNQPDGMVFTPTWWRMK